MRKRDASVNPLENSRIKESEQAMQVKESEKSYIKQVKNSAKNRRHPIRVYRNDSGELESTIHRVYSEHIIVMPSGRMIPVESLG